jgi:hypothetical protein
VEERIEPIVHERHYTVEQANAALPWVSVRIARIQHALDHLLSAAGTRALELIDTALGGGYPGRAAARATLELLTAAAELEAVDVVLRDPQRGLVDFPSVRDGEEVYLCWVSGEPRVSWWHEPEAGFAGRRRL